MQRILSTYLYIQQKLTTTHLSDIERAGFHGIEIFCAGFHFNYRSADAVRELGDWIGDHHLKLHSLHAPTERDFSPARESGTPISICDPEPTRRLDAVDEVKRALDVAETVPFPLMVLHVCTSRDPNDRRHWDAAFTSLENLNVFARERGVSLALENTPGEMATPANLRHFLEDTRLPGLRLCFDTGHAHLEGEALSGFDVVRELAATTHIHDNHGAEKDEHLLPYEGTIEWEKLLPAMPAELPLVFELREQSPQTPSLDAVRAMVDRVERARS